MKRNVQEFTLVWFESTQKWVAVLDDGKVLDNKYGSVGVAHAAALEATGRGEAEWQLESSTGDVQRYVKDDEYWVEDVTMEQLIVAANTVVGCYERNPANFASALKVLAETAEAARGQI